MKKYLLGTFVFNEIISLYNDSLPYTFLNFKKSDLISTC
ncbi:hypothetical protein CRENPOLYSF1_1710005 [Crenothrix polyspora]|uniref:Uncharacterized protein n=1 Tax=Crenothrix polyspora TaxID=360316 RepID=A0A1R4H4E4_9GAMM|nr:hypothetical protein CRENPOLYSF1_1710005 [Crenothrix polyspora]